VRTPEEVLGDVHSQVVGNEVGGRQLVSFLDEFGLPDIEELSDAIIERTERAMRARIAALPDGDYRYGLEIDGFDAPVRIAVTVRVQGDELTVDYAGTSPAVDRGINVALNYTAGYTTYGVKCAISPDVPNNEGSFRPVTVSAPDGCILNAPYPCAIGGRHLVGHFLPSAVFGALADALPERVIAPGADALWDTQIFGEDPRTGRRFTYVWFSAGGTGALATKDGLSATAFPSGIAGVPAEVIETLSPVVVKRRELRQDSGGPGEFRGGLGQTLELAVQGERPFMFSGLYERIDHPAPGLHGGGPGGAGALGANRPEIALSAKARVPLPAGTEITLGLPGGGGYGPPSQRDPARVLADVRDGYVSLERARRDYGVAIDPERMIVLDEETARLRARIAEEVDADPGSGH
jgi:N-methylhydantoinase B